MVDCLYAFLVLGISSWKYTQVELAVFHCYITDNRCTTRDKNLNVLGHLMVDYLDVLLLFDYQEAYSNNYSDS